MISVRVPLRIDLCSGGDLPSICSIHERHRPTGMNIAINKYITIAISNSDDNNMYINGKQYNKEDLDIIGNNKLIAGILSYYPYTPINVDIQCDTLDRAGLGGSGAVSIAILYAIRKYYGLPIGDIVYDAHKLENAVPQCLTGFQDQLAALHGGFNLWNFHYISNERVIPENMKLNDIQYNAIHDNNYDGISILDVNILHNLEDRILLFNPRTIHNSIEINTNQVNNYYMVKTSGKWINTFRDIEDCFTSICNGDYERAIKHMNNVTNLRVEYVDGICNDNIKSLIDVSITNRCGIAICGAGNGHVWVLCPDNNAKDIMISEGSKYAEYIDIKIDRGGIIEW